uniref:Uncharacterized protein n=1 Tax=Oryza sativa subsp. japonica TaxID=39947 RepID=Q2R2J4_ORYSJ|nr:hypothetical protein LOC_Os11g35610 [Oryza sativa Japonica Group]
MARELASRCLAAALFLLLLLLSVSLWPLFVLAWLEIKIHEIRQAKTLKKLSQMSEGIKAIFL